MSRWRRPERKHIDPIIVRMQEDLKDLGRSLHTRRVYVQTVTHLRRHLGCPLQEAELEDVRKYMRDLIRSENYTAQTFRVYAAGIRFVFKVTKSRPEVMVRPNQRFRSVRVPLLRCIDPPECAPMRCRCAVAGRSSTREHRARWLCRRLFAVIRCHACRRGTA